MGRSVRTGASATEGNSSAETLAHTKPDRSVGDLSLDPPTDLVSGCQAGRSLVVGLCAWGICWSAQLFPCAPVGPFGEVKQLRLWVG